MQRKWVNGDRLAKREDGLGDRLLDWACAGMFLSLLVFNLLF